MRQRTRCYSVSCAISVSLAIGLQAVRMHVHTHVALLGNVSQNDVQAIACLSRKCSRVQHCAHYSCYCHFVGRGVSGL